MINKTYISIAFRTALAIFLFLSSGVHYVFASKGDGDGKAEKGVVLRVSSFELKKVYMTPRSLMNLGATYKRTIFPQAPTTPTTKKNDEKSPMVTYERGNTIYIVPLQTPKIMQKFKTPSRSNIKY